MPRTPRFFEPEAVYHLTHRCHNKAHLLRFIPERRCYRWWLWQGVRRYQVSLLAWMITRNHVHLLVQATEPERISRFMQLVEGQVGETYNRRKNRSGAFWGDRFHATAVESGIHLWRCLVYIALNMVRAQAVPHPLDWPWCSYTELRQGRIRHRILDEAALLQAVGCQSLAEFLSAEEHAVASRLADGTNQREPLWTETVAVGGEGFVRRNALAVARYRHAAKPAESPTHTGTWILRASSSTYA